MADNVNIIVQDTINDIVVNAAVVVETIDINVQAAVDEVQIIANPNNYVVNINRIIGEQVQSDWDQTDNQAPDYIKNKPSIPAAQVNSDWNATTGVAEILNKPTIPTNTSDLVNDGEDGVNPFITAADIPPVTGFVPYTGATEDVNLGEYELKAGQVEFDQTPTGTAGVGVMRWNDTDGTVDLGLKGGNVNLQIGQEEVVRVVNKAGINLLEANYQCVRIRTQAEGGAQGQRLAVKLAQANTKANHTGILGLVTETINNNQEGFITTFGNVSNIDTTGSLQGQTWLDGDSIWLSETVAGGLTNVEPTTHPVQIGYVVYAHQNNGKIFVSVSQGVDQLGELHDVSITSVANNDGLFYDSADSLWKNKTIASALGYTPFQLPALTSGSVLFSNGTTIAQSNAQLFWDDTNNRLGIGTATPSYTLDVNGAARVSGTTTITPAALTGTAATSALDIAQTWNTTGTPTAIKLNITNTASNASSTLLSLQSNSNNIFRILNTGQVFVGTNNNIGFWVNDDGTNTSLITGRTLVFSHGLSSQAQNGFVFKGANNNLNATSGTQTLANFTSGFNPTSGTSVFNLCNINGTINQTGGANGITRGLFINPTLTSAADFRAIENSVGKVCLNTTSGNTMIGATTDAGFKLDVNGTARLNGLQTLQGTVASDTAPLGNELLTTGTADASWTGTSFATGYTHVAGSVTTLTSTLAAVINTYYQITYTVTGRTAGSFTIAFGGSSTAGITATGATGPRATTTGTLVITPTTDFNGTIVLSIRTIGTSSATTTFRSSAGTTSNEIRVSNITTNTFIGLNAGVRNTTGSNNTANGVNALYNNTTGGNNTANGVGALYNNTTGGSNVANGVYALSNNTTGVNNTANGVNALSNNTTGGNNTANGVSALFSNTTGGSNTANGQNAGRYIADGSTSLTVANQSIFIGADTKALANSQTNQIVIGFNAIGIGSNSVVLGNDSITKTALKGNVLINTTTDAGFKLDVNGTARVSGAIQANGFFTNTAYGIGMNSPATAIRISTNDNGANIITNNVPFFTFANNGTAINRTSGTGRWFELASFVSFAPTSGTCTMDWFSIAPTINQTGTANGITRGLYINPTLTAAADFRAIEVSNGGAYINTTSVQASAILQADSTTKGFLPPRMTTTQKNAIATPAAGLMIYDNILNRPCFYDGTTWITL